MSLWLNELKVHTTYLDEDGLEKVEKIIFPGLSELLQSSRDIYLLDSWDTIIRLLGTHLHRKTSKTRDRYSRTDGHRLYSGPCTDVHIVTTKWELFNTFQNCMLDKFAFFVIIFSRIKTNNQTIFLKRKTTILTFVMKTRKLINIFCQSRKFPYWKKQTWQASKFELGLYSQIIVEPLKSPKTSNV